MTTATASSDAAKLASRASSAMARLENSVRTEPSPGYAQNAYGDYFKTSAFEKALSLLDEAIVASREDGGLLYLRAGYLAWAGRLVESAAAYEAVIAGFPDCARNSMAQLARVYGLLGRIPDALEMINRHNALLAASPIPGIPALDLRRIGIES